jgi:adenosine deaminase
MTQGTLDPQTLRALPKVDLHRHLEGSVRLETAFELAQAGLIPLPADASKLERILTIQPQDPRTPSGFLSKFGSIRHIFQTEAIIQRVVREAIHDAASDRVRYLEMHITPSALGQALGLEAGPVLDLVLDAGSALETEAEVRWVVSVNRHEPVPLAEAAIEAAIDRQRRGVVGIDLAGDEQAHGVVPFQSAFGRAKEAGLCISVHAGEWDGADSVRRAIELLGADRIAHGVRVLESRAIALDARDRVHFTVCLTSNVQSGVVDIVSHHPLPQMIQAGLSLSLSSDDPAVSGIDMSSEYGLAVAELGLSFESLRGLIMSAGQGSFLPKQSKRALLERLQAEIGLAPVATADGDG